jgi:hypothetical protein
MCRSPAFGAFSWWDLAKKPLWNSMGQCRSHFMLNLRIWLVYCASPLGTK